MGTGLWFVSWAIAKRMRERECVVRLTDAQREHLTFSAPQCQIQWWVQHVFHHKDTGADLPILFQQNLLGWETAGVILWQFENNMAVCLDLPFSLNTVMMVSPQEVLGTNNTHCALSSTLAEAGLCSVQQLFVRCCVPLSSLHLQNLFHSTEPYQLSTVGRILPNIWPTIFHFNICIPLQMIRLKTPLIVSSMKKKYDN